MGINVRVKKSPKSTDAIKVHIRLEKDLKSCMKCKYFHGNNHQCILKKCVKEEEKPEVTEEDKLNKCYGCPYPHPEGYCFPCIADISGRKKGKHNDLEQEEMKDG